MNKETKTRKNKKRKPLRRAQHWGGEVLPMAGRLLTLLIAVVVLGLMFSALQGIESLWLRSGISLVIVAGVLALYFNEGLSKGARDAQNSRSYDAAKTAGRELTKKDDASCYQPLKALCAALAVFGVFFVLSLYNAAMSERYTYLLQDLPTWLSQTYGARSDIMAPLGAYAAEQGMTALDWIRLIVRLPEMMYINFFADPLTMSHMIDMLSPLMILSYPLVYMIGYLTGPKMQRKVVAQNKRAKKIAVRKTNRSTLVSELLGEQNQVHYGQRREDDKHKRKELV